MNTYQAFCLKEPLLKSEKKLNQINKSQRFKLAKQIAHMGFTIFISTKYLLYQLLLLAPAKFDVYLIPGV